ncbi:MAG: hypothetical protein HHJ11_15465 [Phycicoccus sp.]|nr:hypothetical protein [Phycicoccus sp.]
MSVQHTITTGLAAGALLGASLLLAPTATAAPPNPYPLGTFTCVEGSSSRTLDVSGVNLPRFPRQVGFVGGKAIVGRWMRNVDEGTLNVIEGPNGIEDISFSVDFSGPLNPGRQASTPDLSRLTPCSTGGGGISEQFTLDPGSVDQLGLDDNYVGALVTVTDTWSETVWINPVQLSKR